MSDSKIPTFQSYEEMADFCDSNSLADYWDQTKPAEFEVSDTARRHHLVQVDRDLLTRAQNLARRRGISTESLVNLLLSQRLDELVPQT